MAITKNLGGNRLGSGNKNNIELHGYNRSTHDLSRAWRSSMNVGTLVPFMCEVDLTGDTWSIDLESIVRTIPATGPLYGSYKLQLDVFTAPIRLYNGLLHNNMTKIGMNMAQVKLPKITLSHTQLNPFKYAYEVEHSQIATDSLMNYLGLNGIADGNFRTVQRPDTIKIQRKFNAVPILAYWDIYKNYYANKQEETGVMISANTSDAQGGLTQLINRVWNHGQLWNTTVIGIKADSESTPPIGIVPTYNTYQELENTYNFEESHYYLAVPQGFNITECDILLEETATQAISQIPLLTVFPNTNNQLLSNNELDLGGQAAAYQTGYNIIGFTYNPTGIYTSNIALKTFDLANIDQMRIDILQATGLGNELDIANTDYLPYSDLSEQDNAGNTMNKYSQHGLAIKTYQSDLFNNWINEEWITGVNGIASVTAVDTSGGSFTIDALNLAKKVYNMLNRIAVSGGSYEDYLEAVYGIEVSRRAESPIYMGGMSAEIVFEEVVSTSQTDKDPLGTLAGKGTQSNKRGGQIEFRLEEPSFIIGIVSITPRIDYSQGNKWYLTDLDTVDDLHKPELDGIGFQNLMQEQMAWWGTIYDQDSGLTRAIAGKVPAWINYMTSHNETHGDFADEKKTMYMTLNRRYEYQYEEYKPGGIKDMTTYINPTKYNYNFADHNLNAQNFWVQIGIKAIPRRLMSAKIIPNM